MLTWVLLSIFFYFMYRTFRKPDGLPPGRWGLPVIGYFPLYSQDVGTVISDLRKEYGNIFTWKIGGLPQVVLCDYKLIRTTFNKPQCQGRPYFLSLEISKHHTNSGILSSTGDVWSEGRRFTIRHLKELGLGKSSLESVIQYEVQVLLDDFEKSSGTPIHIPNSLNVAIFNVIWKLVADLRYDINDEYIKKFHETINEKIRISQNQAIVLDLFPGMHKYMPKFVLNKLMRVDVMYKTVDDFSKLIGSVIKDHEEKFDLDNPKDFIDAYLKEIHKERDNPNTIFKDDHVNLLSTIGDLFAAGSETTSSTIRWIIALLAKHQHVQKKMQLELDEAVPSNRLPSWQDKDKLHYTQAVFMEVMRYSSYAPIGLVHSTTEDIEIGGYHIPKDTILMASAITCHRNPKYFERPDEFYPEHFLDDEGKVNPNKEGFLPFSLGQRQCLGEKLARMELFLFGAGLFHKFNATSPEGQPIAAEKDPTVFVLNLVKPYKVVFTKRN